MIVYPEYDFKAVSCTPTYLKSQCASLCIEILMKLDVVRLTLLISMCQENGYAKMEKLEAQICRCTRQGLEVIL